eukprot:contig_9317_g2224
MEGEGSRSTKLFFDRLDEDYRTWSTYCKASLKDNGNWVAVVTPRLTVNPIPVVVTPPDGEPAATAAAHAASGAARSDHDKQLKALEEWERRDERAQAEIQLAVKPHLLNIVSECQSAAEAWDCLRILFEDNTTSRRAELERDLQNLKLGAGESIIKFKKLEAVMGEDVPPAVQAYLASLTVGAGSNSSKNKRKDVETKRPVCFYCKKPGHKIAECLKRKATDKKKGGGRGDDKGKGDDKKLAYAARVTPKVAAQAVATTRSDEWVVDSGTTHHMARGGTPFTPKAKVDDLVTTASGARYLMMMYEDSTGLAMGVPIRAKSNTGWVLMGKIPELERRCGKKLKRIRFDGAREFVTPQLLAWYGERGIDHEVTPPYSPESNGKAERVNRTVKERLRAALAEAGFEEELWAEAAVAAIFVMNRSPKEGLDTTPWEAFTGQRPDVSGMAVWGSTAYALKPLKQHKG